MSKPSNVELDAVKEHLFLFRPNSETRLAPVNHDAATNAKFLALASEPLFDKLGLAIVVHPPAGPNGTSPPPQAFLKNAGDNWNIGSAGKLSLPLAALVLRQDVQRLVTAGLVTKTTPAEKLDALFRYVWQRHPSPAIAALALGKQWPSPSRVLDWFGDSVVIQGSFPSSNDEWNDLITRSGDGHIAFGDLARTNFTEFLLLAIGLSDNVAARVCQGALGVGFADAVIEKMGLFELKSPSWTLGGGAGMRVAGLYGATTMPELPAGWPLPNPALTRQTKAFWITPKGEIRPDKQPFVGTARSMATLLTAIMTDSLLDVESSLAFRNYLQMRPGLSLRYQKIIGTFDAADRALNRPADPSQKFFNKIGLHRPFKLEVELTAQFLHVKIRLNNYSIIALGLSDFWASDRFWNEVDREQELFKRIHAIIAAANP